MNMISDVFGGLLKPLVLGVVLLVGLGLVSADPAAGRTGADGFSCKGFFNDADWNRALCRFHPARIWNTPIADLVPFLGQE
jgi:hypothetical protein